MSLLSALKEEKKVDTKPLLARYREIIERASQPAAGDVEALRDLMKQLGLTTADVESDVWALPKLREFRRQIAEVSEVPEQMEARTKKVEALRADLTKAQEEVKRLDREIQATIGEGQGRSVRRQQAYDGIRELAHRNPRIFENPSYAG